MGVTRCAGAKANCAATTTRACCGPCPTTHVRADRNTRRGTAVVLAVALLGALGPSALATAAAAGGTDSSRPATVFVAREGSDRNPGTNARPLRTIGAAVAHAKP